MLVLGVDEVLVLVLYGIGLFDTVVFVSSVGVRIDEFINQHTARRERA